MYVHMLEVVLLSFPYFSSSCSAVRKPRAKRYQRNAPVRAAPTTRSALALQGKGAVAVPCPERNAGYQARGRNAALQAKKSCRSVRTCLPQSDVVYVHAASC